MTRLPSLRYAFLLLLLPAFAAAKLGDGCAITIIQTGSAADKAGALLGDILKEADGKSIASMSDLHIAVTPVDGEFVMRVQRGDKLITLKAEVHPTTAPDQPKLGIKCIPVVKDMDISTSIAVPAAVPVPVSVPVSAPIPVRGPATAILEDTSPLEAAAPLNCPFPLPSRATAQLTLSDGHTVSGRLVSCDPQEVTIRSGSLSATFPAARILKMELVR
jgi:hypothetical protein